MWDPDIQPMNFSCDLTCVYVLFPLQYITHSESSYLSDIMFCKIIVLFPSHLLYLLIEHSVLTTNDPCNKMLFASGNIWNEWPTRFRSSGESFKPRQVKFQIIGWCWLIQNTLVDKTLYWNWKVARSSFTPSYWYTGVAFGYAVGNFSCQRQLHLAVFI